MNEADRALAEAVVRRLCEGAQVDGIRFGPVPQVLISHHGSGKPSIPGQVYLNLSSKWVLRSAGDPRPELGVPLSELTEDEALHLLCSLREKAIRRADIEPETHLRLTLEDGSVLFINGGDPQYESWELGVAFGGTAELWKVVACPGGDVAVWAPAAFVNERAG